MAPWKVLVAEDDPSVRMTLQFALEDEGFEVLLAEDGARALDLARSESPDVILLDQVMPRMDGTVVVRHLRSDEATRAIPVFILSGIAERGPEFEGVGFIPKPFALHEVVSRIREVLEA